jgi:hypothetical protein
MTNSGIIEGHAGNSSGCSDLSLAISSCQSVPNPPMNVGDWATIGRAANHAGQHSNRATTVWWIAGSGGGKGLWPVVALKQTPPHYRRNPLSLYAEKEARLRPQPFISSRSRMGTSIRCSCEGGSRGPASAFRFTFGSGGLLVCAMQAKASKAGRLMKSRYPAPKSL